MIKDLDPYHTHYIIISTVYEEKGKHKNKKHKYKKKSKCVSDFENLLFL